MQGFAVIVCGTVGGFGFIATSDAVKHPLIKLTLESPYTNINLIVPAALIGIILMVLAKLIERIGQAKSPDEGGNEPEAWFYSIFGLAFGCAWRIDTQAAAGS